MDPMFIYNAIVRLDGARLDQLVEELKPASRRMISRLIRRLVAQKMIHRIGYEWFPCRNTSGPSGPSGPERCKEEHSSKNPVAEGCPTEEGLASNMEDEHRTGDSRSTGLVKGQQPADAALAGAGPQMEFDKRISVKREPTSGVQLVPAQAPRDMYSLKTNPVVLRHIVLKVRKARSRHNRGEGAKWAQAKKKGEKYYKMKLVPKETIEDMRDLADTISAAVAHRQWWENEARLVDEMTRLIPDWRHGYKKALRDLDMILAVEEEEEDRVYSQPDLTDATLWSEMIPAVDEHQEGTCQA